MTDAVRLAREQAMRIECEADLHAGHKTSEFKSVDILDLLDQLAAARQERAALEQALREAIEGWDYNRGYKDEYLVKKHGDREDIARLRALLPGAGEKK